MKKALSVAALVLAFGASAAAESTGPTPRLSGVLSGQLPDLKAEPGKDPAVLPEEPPEQVPHEKWTDWAEGQDVTPLRRIAIEIALGSAKVNGPDYWEETFSEGAGFLLEAGYCFAPFLSVSSLFLFGSLSGGSVNDLNVDGLSYDLRPGSVQFYYLGVDARIRIPLVLIGPALFRFSKAETGTGLVPFLRFGFGASHFNSADAWRSWDDPPGFPHTDTVRLIRASNRFGYHFGFGVQVRWPWGSLSLEFALFDLGKPALAWASGVYSGPGGGRIPIAHVGLGAGIYF